MDSWRKEWQGRNHGPFHCRRLLAKLDHRDILNHGLGRCLIFPTICWDRFVVEYNITRHLRRGLLEDRCNWYSKPSKSTTCWLWPKSTSMKPSKDATVFFWQVACGSLSRPLRLWFSIHECTTPSPRLLNKRLSTWRQTETWLGFKTLNSLVDLLRNWSTIACGAIAMSNRPQNFCVWHFV